MNQHDWYTKKQEKLQSHVQNGRFQALWEEFQRTISNNRINISFCPYDGKEKERSSSGMLFNTGKPYIYLNIIHKDSSKALQINVKGLSRMLRDCEVDTVNRINVLKELLHILFLKDGRDADRVSVSAIKENLDFETQGDSEFMKNFESWILRGWLWHHQNELLPFELREGDPDFEKLFSRVIQRIYQCGTGRREVRAECKMILDEMWKQDIRYVHFQYLLSIANASCWCCPSHEKEQAFAGLHERIWEEYIPNIQWLFQVEQYDAMIRSGILPSKQINKSLRFWTENLSSLLAEGNLHLVKALFIILVIFLKEENALPERNKWFDEIVRIAFGKAYEAKRVGVAISLNNEFQLEKKINTEDHTEKVRKCHELLERIGGTIGFTDAERFI